MQDSHGDDVWKSGRGCSHRVGACGPGEQATTGIPDVAPCELDLKENASQIREDRAARPASATCGGLSASLGYEDQVRDGSVWVRAGTPALVQEKLPDT